MNIHLPCIHYKSLRLSEEKKFLEEKENKNNVYDDLCYIILTIQV